MSSEHEDILALAEQIKAAGGRGGNIEFLLAQLPQETAHRFRLAAIPHGFNALLLRVLDPGVKPDEAETLCQQFATLSMVITREDEYIIHDNARHYLFEQWLAQMGRNYETFREASERLADHFATLARAMTDGFEYRARSMFHLIGADQAAGIERFECLVRESRRRYDLNQCETLINLAHEYDPVLTQAHRLCIAYQEGKLALDHRDWHRAKDLLTAAEVGDGNQLELRVKCLLRLGMAHAGLKEWPLAELTLNQAISLIDGHPELDKLRHNVQHELGIVLRDSGTGKTHEAGHLLRQAAARALRYADYPSLATVLNTLATLYLRHREIPKAKAALKDALEALRRSGDRFREAAILNNLGLAEMEQRNWGASSKHFAQALDIETNAGHIHGQAVCLNNLGRAYRNLGQMQDAQVAATKASELFARVADPFNAAVAQRNLARIYRRSGNIEAARVAFQVAAGWFRAATAIGEVETTEQEAARLGLKDGIPWWVWLSAVILISILVAALLAAFLRRGIV